MESKSLVLFPPGWNMNVGSPHLGLPLLQVIAKMGGVEVFIRDLNWEMSEYLSVKPSLNEVYGAVERGDLDSFNGPYFRAEDRLMEIARVYAATWNVQLGFQYGKYTPDSSTEVMEAGSAPSPFKEYYEKHVLPYVREIRPQFIGFSIASPGQLIPAFQLCRMLKEDSYDGLIMMGGNIMSRLRDAVNNPDLYEFVDLFVFYQGEISLTQIINRLKDNNTDFSGIPNVAFFDGKKVVVTPVSERLNLQDLPAPDFDGFPLGEYWGENYVTLVAARGCYYGKCYFCAIPLGWNTKGFAGVRRPHLVFEDMVQIYRKYGAARFKFVDEALIPNLMVVLAERIKKSGLPFEWEGYTRLEKIWLDEQFVKTVAEGGFRKGHFGLEVYPTGNRSALNKHDSPDPEKLLKICNKYGIKVHFFCLFGFPGTGRAEAEATIDFVLRHAQLIDTIDIYRFGYMRHTKVPGIRAVIDPKNDWAMEYNWVPVEKGVLTKHEAEEIKVELEEIMWSEHPRMLHPTYRLITPWSPRCREEDRASRNLQVDENFIHDAISY